MSETPRHDQTTITLATRGPGLYPFLGSIDRWLKEIGATLGVVTAFCRHTSASLTIQENADPDVLRDLTEFFARLAPENTPWFRHMQEGPDDMPAHIRATLSDVSLSVPVADGGMTLGTWQEIYLVRTPPNPAHPHRGGALRGVLSLSHRRPEDACDVPRPGGEHDQPVHPQRDARALRHAEGQRVQEIPVHRYFHAV